MCDLINIKQDHVYLLFQEGDDSDSRQHLSRQGGNSQYYSQVTTLRYQLLFYPTFF